MLFVIIWRLFVVSVVLCEDGESLRERLNRIEGLNAKGEGVIKAYISSQLPEYTDIFCEPQAK